MKIQEEIQKQIEAQTELNKAIADGAS